MKEEKILSVLIPCYKFANYIEDCIDSVYRQKTNFDFNVIVGDDFSQDGTQEILKRLKKEKYSDLVILETDHNLGGLKNIKRLIEGCNSKYISYLDGDDLFFDENKLQHQVDFLEANPDYAMHFTGCKYLYNDGSTYPPESGSLITGVKSDMSREDILTINYVGFGRTFRNNPGLIKDYFNELPYVDWPLNYEISKHGKIKYEFMHGGFYRISEDGIFSTKTEEEKNMDNQKVSSSILEEERRYTSQPSN